MNKYSATFTAFAAFFATFTGCSKSQRVNSTHVDTVAAGHRIIADIDGIASVENQSTQAVIASQFGQIIIERSRVLLGSNAWTDIPNGAPITLSFSQDKYSVQWTTNK